MVAHLPVVLLSQKALLPLCPAITIACAASGEMEYTWFNPCEAILNSSPMVETRKFFGENVSFSEQYHKNCQNSTKAIEE